MTLENFSKAQKIIQDIGSLENLERALCFACEGDAAGSLFILKSSYGDSNYLILTVEEKKLLIEDQLKLVRKKINTLSIEFNLL